MPQLTLSTVSILPPAQSSGGSAKQHANNLRYNTRGSSDAPLWQSACDGLTVLQSQIDNVVEALRQALPQPQVIQITGPTGSLIAQIGNMTGSDNVSYPGIWAKDLYVGGDGPDTAVIVASDGGVVISGVGLVISTGVVDAAGYKVAGVPGIDLSSNFGTSLTVGTSSSGLFGAPGAGQANGTVVTGVTLNTSAHTFAKGILTA